MHLVACIHDFMFAQSSCLWYDDDDDDNEDEDDDDDDEDDENDETYEDDEWIYNMIISGVISNNMLMTITMAISVTIFHEDNDDCHHGCY